MKDPREISLKEWIEGIKKPQRKKLFKFEHLIADLYNKLGYETMMTLKTHDGGRDIIAKKSDPSRREKTLIQCGISKRSIGVGTVRALLGVVSDERATKGVFATNSKFSSAARKLAESNSRIELLEWKDLHVLLNKKFGINWPYNIDRIIADSIEKK